MQKIKRVGIKAKKKSLLEHTWLKMCQLQVLLVAENIAFQIQTQASGLPLNRM